jgi:hypothetical protein
MSYEKIKPANISGLPTVLVVGAAKAATTWLYACLDDHPEVAVARRGEVDFFSKYYYKGYEWYRNQFLDTDGKSVIVDISPTYMIDPGTPARLKHYGRAQSIVFCLRDPIDRLYSHYCMHLKGGLVSEEIDKEIKDIDRYTEEGLYAKHISRYLNYFDRSKLTFLIYDELVRDEREYIKKVFNMLGVDASFRPSVLGRKHQSRGSRPRSMWIYRSLTKFSDIIQKNIQSKIATKGIKWARRRGLVDYFHFLNEGDDFPQISSELKKKLAEYYRDDLKALNKIVDTDISHWTNFSGHRIS